ncbi:hypothetical protein [Streptomyces sp. MBT62]|uniref:hypothetical protein n=1 Tax=Streptomyces sp. MBT62 TaxID=2800410 RepID=UPI00190AFBF9|nr:hypothetical protein [Streptomyces sp. MBT62]MBK3565219.1 hypothetical protein [Streptomyces sp. MBT62]
MDGFTSVHDPLYVRVLVLDDAATRLAVAVLDQTSIHDDQLARARDNLRDVAEVDPANALIIASHTFSAPHIRPSSAVPEAERAKNSALAAAFDDALTEATTNAVRGLRTARIGFATGRCRANVQRDVPTPHGWWLGADDSGPVDDTVGVLRIDGTDGRPVALLVNYAVQSSIMNGSRTESGERHITADLAGAAVRNLEQRYADSGTVAFFLVGAAGDQAPFMTAVRATTAPDGTFVHTDLGEQGYFLMELLGDRLACEVARVSDQTLTQPLAVPLKVTAADVEVSAQIPPASLESLHPSRSYDFHPAGTSHAPVLLARIGDTAFVGVQAELTVRTSLALKAVSPFAATCVVTMVNGAAKYMADATAYERITYAAMNSHYGEGAAETAGRFIHRLLRDL